MRSLEKTIVFKMEPADRSVGIMSEGFSAWELHGDSWCSLDDISPPKFSWYDNNTGDDCAPPKDSSMVEQALLGFANGFYENDQ